MEDTVRGPTLLGSLCVLPVVNLLGEFPASTKVWVMASIKEYGTHMERI